MGIPGDSGRGVSGGFRAFIKVSKGLRGVTGLCYKCFKGFQEHTKAFQVVSAVPGVFKGFRSIP